MADPPSSRTRHPKRRRRLTFVAAAVLGVLAVTGIARQCSEDVVEHATIGSFYALPDPLPARPPGTLIRSERLLGAPNGADRVAGALPLEGPRGTRHRGVRDRRRPRPAGPGGRMADRVVGPPHDRCNRTVRALRSARPVRARRRAPRVAPRRVRRRRDRLLRDGRRRPTQLSHRSHGRATTCSTPPELHDVSATPTPVTTCCCGDTPKAGRPRCSPPSRRPGTHRNSASAASPPPRRQPSWAGCSPTTATTSRVSRSARTRSTQSRRSTGRATHGCTSTPSSHRRASPSYRRSLRGACSPTRRALHRIARPAVGDFYALDPSTTPPWREILEQNTPGHQPIGVPILVTQGDADKLVLPATTADFVARLCRAGEHVTYHTYQHIDHGLVGERSVPLLVRWLNDTLTGRPPATTCTVAPAAALPRPGQGASS